jgi:hypothetical protein
MKAMPSLLDIVRAKLREFYPNDGFCPCGREYPTRAQFKGYTKQQIIDGALLNAPGRRRRVSKCCWRFALLPNPFDPFQRDELKRLEKEDRKFKRLQRGIKKGTGLHRLRPQLLPRNTRRDSG